MASRSGHPAVSVVIASHDTAPTIGACLQALQDQPNPDLLEIIVADSSTDGTDRIIRRDFPGVRLLHFTDDLGLAQLRGHGIAAAAADIIAVIDPYSIVGPGWLPALLEAHQRRSNLVIGGAVDLHDADRQRLSAWALYLWEYGRFMPPVTAGPVDILPGSNISYKRPALGDPGLLRQRGFWKTFVNWAVDAREPLWLDPAVVVSLRKPIPTGSFLRTRYDHGRCFAGMRVAGASRSTRVGRALTTPILPLLLWFRVARAFWPKGRRRREFVLTTPTQLLLFANWARGELVGYLRGPGTCCRRLYY